VAVGSIFVGTLILSFGATLLLAGLFGAYYGKGKSRALGFGLAIIALVCLGVFFALTFHIIPGLQPVFEPYAVGRSLAAVAAATVGFAVAVGVFFITITRD
jgi:hypothetical protein